MSNFNKPFYSIEINFIDLKESIYIYTVYTSTIYTQISHHIFLIVRTKISNLLSTLFTTKKKEITSNLSFHLHKPHNKPFPSTPCNTSKTFSRRGEEKKKGKRGGA